MDERLVRDAVVQHIDVGKVLGGEVLAVTRHESDILVTQVWLVHAHHGTAQECFRILVIYDGEQIEGAYDAFGRDAHVVIHEQYVGSARSLFHGLDHASGKTARSTCVGVGMQEDVLGFDVLGVKGATVIDDMHGKVFRNGFVSLDDALFYELDIGKNVVLVFEGCRAKSKFDGADALVINLGVIVAVTDLHGFLAFQQKAHEYVIVELEGDIECDPLFACCDIAPRCVETLGMPCVRIGVRLRERAGGSFKLEVQEELSGVGIAHPLACGQCIEEGGEVEGAGSLQAPFASGGITACYGGIRGAIHGRGSEELPAVFQ